MNLQYDKKIIYKLYKEYNRIYHQIPRLDDIQYIQGVPDAYAQFNSYDLYNKKYILYINPNLCSLSKNTIRQKLFHEFTHIYDSVFLLNQDIESFKQLMKIYSEINASETEMAELILTQHKPYSLNKIISCDLNDFEELTLEEYVTLSAIQLINEFKIIDIKSDLENDDLLDCVELYYFIGELKALKNFGLTCNIDILNSIDKPFYDIIHKIIEYCMSHELNDLNKLKQLHNEFINVINTYRKQEV